MYKAVTLGGPLGGPWCHVQYSEEQVLVCVRIRLQQAAM